MNVAYLTTELSKYVNVNKSHLLHYNLIKLRRFLAINIMAFSFQYLCVYHLQTYYPIYPIYPAIGIAFAVIALLGGNAIVGLFLGVICAYYLKEFPLTTMVCYSIADILCATLGTYICKNIFSSDIPKHISNKVWLHFILVNILVCSLSGLLRIFALILNETSLPSITALLYIYLDLCISDLNAIILFYAFLSMWLSIYMSREKVSHKKINYLHIGVFIAFIGICVLLMKNTLLIYLLLLGMMMALFYSYFYGLLIATLLMYVISMLYLTYFMIHQLYYMKWLKLGGYTLIPCVLLLFILSGIFLSRKPYLNKH